VIAGRALNERFHGQTDLPATESPREWVESLTSHLNAAAACAVVEHLFGVLPLVDAFFTTRGAITEVAAGRRLGALGLFTPGPELRWGAAAVLGEPEPSGSLLLRGEVRIPSPAADGSLVLVRLRGRESVEDAESPEHRLAWLDHDLPGVERRGSRTGGPVRRDAPCWLAIEGAAIGPDLVSRPVTPAPGSGLFRCLESYAGVWAFAAAICARDGVRALRRAARTTGPPGKAFSSCQLVAMDITEVEIEADLTLAAARGHLALAADDSARCDGFSALALAAAAARTLAAVAARTGELRDLAGLELDAPGEGIAPSLTTFLGGPLMVEGELGRALGIRDPADAAP